MGKSESKEEAKDIAEVNNESGGFHLIELHMPTIGIGAVTIALVVLGACCLFASYRRYCQRRPRHQLPHHHRRRHQEPEHSMPMTTFLPPVQAPGLQALLMQSMLQPQQLALPQPYALRPPSMQLHQQPRVLRQQQQREQVPTYPAGPSRFSEIPAGPSRFSGIPAAAAAANDEEEEASFDAVTGRKTATATALATF